MTAPGTEPQSSPTAIDDERRQVGVRVEDAAPARSRRSGGSRPPAASSAERGQRPAAVVAITACVPPVAVGARRQDLDDLELAAGWRTGATCDRLVVGSSGRRRSSPRRSGSPAGKDERRTRDGLPAVTTVFALVDAVARGQVLSAAGRSGRPGPVSTTPGTPLGRRARETPIVAVGDQRHLSGRPRPRR